jgi:hypothetical protein
MVVLAERKEREESRPTDGRRIPNITMVLDEWRGKGLIVHTTRWSRVLLIDTPANSHFFFVAVSGAGVRDRRVGILDAQYYAYSLIATPSAEQLLLQIPTRLSMCLHLRTLSLPILPFFFSNISVSRHKSPRNDQVVQANLLARRLQESQTPCCSSFNRIPCTDIAVVARPRSLMAVWSCNRWNISDDRFPSCCCLTSFFMGNLQYWTVHLLHSSS